MIQLIRSILAWAQKNERHISTLVYVAGFVSDIFTFTLVSVSFANLLFLGYLIMVPLCILGSYFFTVRGYDNKQGIVWKALGILLPLGVQFFTGNLLSGFLIFYTKSAFVFASWPFLLVLALVFIGNELFRDFRSHLAFQTILFFFALYTYLIFALPLLLHALSPVIFIESTAASIGLFVSFITVLAFISLKRLAGVWYMVAGGIVTIVAVVVGSYFAGLIPPIPLTLTEAGVYHSVIHTSSGYEVTTETSSPDAWWQIGPLQQTTIHIIPGDSLSIYSSIFAPIDFGTRVVHRWEIYDDATHRWVERSTVTFPIAGGRNGGYRGYSTVSDIQPGKYRVSIETTSGQVIGRVLFTVQAASVVPILHTEVK